MLLWLRIIFILSIVALLVLNILSYLHGKKMVAPNHYKIDTLPEGLAVKNVQIRSRSGSLLSGWFTEKENAKGSILLLHGIRSDRQSMVGRARFLDKLGYNTLSIDFQGHGESPGEHITLGHLEARDAAASVAYLREHFPKLPIASIGVSLGAASSILADYQGQTPDALIIEAAFSDIATAVENRMVMRFGVFGKLISPIMTLQLRPILGLSANELSPLNSIKNIQAPTLFIYGSKDRHATPDEGKSLFEAANEPKEYWQIEGAAHDDFHETSKTEYEKRIKTFLEKYL